MSMFASTVAVLTYLGFCVGFAAAGADDRNFGFGWYIVCVVAAPFIIALETGLTVGDWAWNRARDRRESIKAAACTLRSNAS